MTAPIFEITKAATFDAAHHLPMGAEADRHTRLHGHSFEVEATLRGEARSPVGWVENLNDLERVLKATAGELDHTLLNEHGGLESPTLEALCLWFADRLAPRFPGLAKVAVSRPTVRERCVLELSRREP